MRHAGIVLAAALVIAAPCSVFAQQAMQGRVARIDQAAGKVAIQLDGTTGAAGATAPTQFKLKDPALIGALKPGDHVSFTSENVNGVPTIGSLSKD
jgi:Cu/Ag efflux protein CusF